MFKVQGLNGAVKWSSAGVDDFPIGKFGKSDYIASFAGLFKKTEVRTILVS